MSEMQTRPVFLSEHPQRYSLTNELHARPFERFDAPVQVSMYASVVENGDQAEVLKHLETLCKRYGVNPPTPDMNHFSADFGPFRLRFERHTEFISVMAIRKGSFSKAFDRPASSYVPNDWLERLPGEILVATHLALLDVEGEDPNPEELAELFVPNSLVTSTLSGGSAQVWTDLRIHEDGHNRILVKPREIPAPKAGRLIQRLLEIATYRNFALLALPVARRVGPELDRIDGGLAALTREVSALSSSNDTEIDEWRGTELLDRLMRISSEIERLNSQHSYRFAAARAYSELVRSRLIELREERHEGYQTIQEFLDRRLWPAMRTCESVEERLADVSRRATRAANLLRTRVDFVVQQQNQGLLGSMDRRAKLQLRLQETVEGLSVAAITYYAVGLVGYAAKALKDIGALPVEPALIQGLAVPVVAIGVWMGLHRFRKRLERDD